MEIMGVHSLDFPVEIWLQIAHSLDIEDLLTLRSVNTFIQHTIEANEIWGPLVRQRWFSTDDTSLDDFLSIKSQMAYYKRRHLKDVEVRRALKQRPFALKDGWKIAEMDEEIAPVLVELKNDKNDLTTRYYASSILEVIRHRTLVKRVEQYFSDTTPAVQQQQQPLFEDVCTDVCRFDREFDRLLPYRMSTLNSTIQGVKNHPEYDQEATPTATVLLIIRILGTEIHRQVISGYTDDSLENLSILRFYAGETEGTQIVQYAVIQKLASAFNIKTSIGTTFLIVEDDSFKSGSSYISLKKDLFGPKVFSISDIYSFVRRNNPNDPMVSLHELTCPLTVSQYLKSILDFRRLHSLAHGWDLLQGSYLYRDTYPCSKNHIPSSMADYYALCMGGLLNTNINLSEFTYLAKKFPFSASFVDDELLKHRTPGFKLDAMSRFRELSRQTPFDRLKSPHHHHHHPHPPLKVGQVVMHAVGYHSVIIGYSITQDGTFYTLLNGVESRASRVKALPREKITSELVDLLTDDYKTGVYFTRFDEEKGTFELTPDLQRAYPNL